MLRLSIKRQKICGIRSQLCSVRLFFPSITKPDAVKCNGIELQKLKGKLKIPIVAIGITNTNARTIIQYGADLVAVSSYIYDSDSPYEKLSVFNRSKRGKINGKRNTI